MPLNIAREIIHDPELGQPWVLLRSYGGSWELGGWQEAERKEIPVFSVVSSAEDEELDLVPEGDRISGAMVFYHTEPIYLSIPEPGGPSVSDFIRWNDKEYKVVRVLPGPYGYWRAFAVRVSGN